MANIIAFFWSNAMGKLSRDKGNRVEREIVKLHEMIPHVVAERVPLSGAMRFQGNGEDVEIRIARTWEGLRPIIVLRGQVKAMSKPRGVQGVLDALGEADVLFIRLDRQEGEQHVRPPLVVLPWETWERLLK